ncbi:MAG: aminoacyl-histidine dipeptidase [Acutalibacteraceae bacterium]|nr:aminoacyl-histidine dipeptidase [Acutalibacteraceae bacterium]
MSKLDKINPKRVFYYFEQISAIPRGSGNMGGIARFCEDFALNHELKYIRDRHDNIVIFKNGTAGYENSDAVILQGHLDMVCQKVESSNIDFEKDGLDLCVDGDFIYADGTTLGADNGIAVAIILAILESDEIAHPPIEAVFTVDEEIGMVGAGLLDKSVLKAKKMINLDSEEDGTVTVSCAGGSDFRVNIPLERKEKTGAKVILKLKGLKGGHSGVEINKGRVNAAVLAGRILNHLDNICDFDIITLNGGDKSNAIPNAFYAELCVDNAELFCAEAKKYIDVIANEICDREKDFCAEILTEKTDKHRVFADDIKNKIIFTLLCVPNGVMQMSADIEGLVETSLNLGILNTTDKGVVMHFALRSNKQSALVFLQEKLEAFFKAQNLPYEAFGHYPPWEYNESSKLRRIYIDVYTEQNGTEPKVEAIHAGLECGVFASAIKDFDCIAIGPALYDVHTVNEKLSISSTENLYKLIIKMLEELK